MTKETEKVKNRAAVALGRLGGKAGVGVDKRRGDAQYYRDLRAGKIKGKDEKEKSAVNQ